MSLATKMLASPLPFLPFTQSVLTLQAPASPSAPEIVASRWDATARHSPPSSVSPPSQQSPADSTRWRSQILCAEIFARDPPTSPFGALLGGYSIPRGAELSSAVLFLASLAALASDSSSPIWSELLRFACAALSSPRPKSQIPSFRPFGS